MDKHWSRLVIEPNQEQRRGGRDSTRRATEPSPCDDHGHEWNGHYNRQAAGTPALTNDDLVFREARMRARVERNRRIMGYH